MRVDEGRDGARGVLLVERHRVVGQRAVGGGQRGGEQVPHTGGAHRLEHVAGAADVDVGHLALVVQRVNDEREVQQRAHAAPGEHLADPRVTHVELVVLEARIGEPRRAHVEADDAVVGAGVEQPADGARPDVAGAAGHGVGRHAQYPSASSALDSPLPA